MKNFFIKATDTTPELKFDLDNNHFSIKGKSYPENSNDFYGEMFALLDQHLAEIEDQDIELNIELSYFNSSSAKVLMILLDMFDDVGRSGNRVAVNWFYHPETDTLREAGEEFAEDLEGITFNLLPLQ